MENENSPLQTDTIRQNEPILENSSVPKDFMTVGCVAKKMNVSVRTLQYYDSKGLFSPSATSEGGRRLYTDKDIVKLHQILSLKSLGFSLDEIKNQLASVETPDEFAAALQEQAESVQNQIEKLSESLREIQALEKEVLQMRTVDFKKYADIIVNLQMKNDFYWLIKHFDEKMLDHVRNRFDKKSAFSFINRFLRLQDKAVRLQNEGISAESEQGQEFAETFWSLINEFTGGDMSLLPKLFEIGQVSELNPDIPENSSGSNSKQIQELKKKQKQAKPYIEKSLGFYFSNSGINPFGPEIN